MLLLTALFLFATPRSVQGEASLLDRIVPAPTGRNGYEEYLRASDAIGSNGWNSYDQWIGYLRSHDHLAKADVDEDQEAPEPPQGVSPDMTELAVRKVANEQLGGAFDLVVSGNEKQVWDPRSEAGITAIYPEFSRFKALAKIGLNRAHIEFSEGRTAVAVRDLLEGLRFSQKICSTTLISNLVGIASEAIMLSGFNEHLGQLSLSDAVMIDKSCRGLLTTPSSVSQAYRQEAGSITRGLDAIIDNPGLAISEESVKNFGQALKDLSPADREKLKEMVTNSLELRYADAANRMDGPESGWMLDEALQDPKIRVDDKSVSNLALMLVNELMGMDAQRNYAKAVAKGRIQLRLLQLHAKIIAFHWERGRWPRRIEEVGDATTVLDPFAQEPFHYELTDSGYRLYSTGIRGLGPIELKYRSAAAAVPQGSQSDHP